MPVSAGFGDTFGDELGDAALDPLQVPDDFRHRPALRRGSRAPALGWQQGRDFEHMAPLHVEIAEKFNEARMHRSADGVIVEADERRGGPQATRRPESAFTPPYSPAPSPASWSCCNSSGVSTST